MQRKLWEDAKISGISFTDLFEAYMECRSNKRNTTNALKFEIDYEAVNSKQDSISPLKN